jgi:hypothetical protein
MALLGRGRRPDEEAIPPAEFMSHVCRGLGELAEFAENPLSSTLKGLAEFSMWSQRQGPTRYDPLSSARA